MKRFVAMGALCIFVSPSLSEANSDKAQDCTYQADVVAAIQQARMDRVKEEDLPQSIAKTEPTWPERYNNAIPILAGPIYQIKRRQLKKMDLAEHWKEACLSS